MRTTDEIFKVITEVVDLLDFAAGLDINLEATVSPEYIKVVHMRHGETIVNWSWYNEANNIPGTTRLDEVTQAIKDWLVDEVPYRVKTVHDPKLNGHVKTA